jgi:hypothetical protein
MPPYLRIFYPLDYLDYLDYRILKLRYLKPNRYRIQNPSQNPR